MSKGEEVAGDGHSDGAGNHSDAGKMNEPSPATEEHAQAGPERRWVWMDRWDPSTWEMPSNPTTLQRVLAAVALLIVAFATFYLPFKLLGIF